MTDLETDLSHIDDEPTAGSENLVKSGGVLNTIVNMSTELDFESLTEYEGTLGRAGWYIPGNHRLIEIKPFTKVIIKSDTIGYYGFLKDFVGDATNGDIPPYAKGGRTQTRPKTLYTLQAPINAKYLCLSSVDGIRNRINYTIKVIDNHDDGLGTRNISYDYEPTNLVVDNYDKLVTNDIYNGILIPVEDLGDYTHMFSRPGRNVRYAFLTQQIDFCVGYKHLYIFDFDNKAISIEKNDIPEDCYYIWVYSNSNGIDVRPFIYTLEANSGVINNIENNISDIEDTVSTIVDNLIPTEESVILDESRKVDLSNYVVYNGSLGSNSWYYNETLDAGKHISIDINSDTLYIVLVVRTRGIFFNWFAMSQGDKTDRTKIISIDNSIRKTLKVGTYVLKVPDRAKYFVPCTVNGDGKATDFDVYQMNDLTIIQDKLVDVIDTNNITKEDGVINGNGTATWYKATGYSHITIPVNPGEKYVIDKNHSIGWSNYAILKTYATTDTFEYATNERRITVRLKTFIEIPSDGHYLVISAQSNGINVLPSNVYKISPSFTSIGDVIYTNSPLKFRFAHWNVGHFTYYDGRAGSSTPSIPAEDSEEMALRYKTLINEINADIFGVCEYDPSFDAAGSVTRNTILRNYKNEYIGTKYDYNCNSIFMNGFNAASFVQIPFTKYTQYRYYTLITLYIKGKKVCIVETHVDWNQSTTGADDRAAQIQELITTFVNEQYVILGGDWNVDSPTEYQPFVDAGYTLANCGYLGNIITYPRTSNEETGGGRLDNIIVKGFTMSNIKVYMDSATKLNEEGGLSDHRAIACDLTMN